MQRFLSSPAYGPFKNWHFIAFVAVLYAMAGTIATGGLVAWIALGKSQPTVPVVSTSTTAQPTPARSWFTAAPPAKPQPPQGITVKEYLAKRPKEPVLVRGQILMSQADSVGFVGDPQIGDSYVLRDDADAKQVHSFDLLRNSHLGRRLYYLLGTGTTKTMTLKMDTQHIGGIVEIVSEN